MSARRRELAYQGHIIDSYKLYGGTGRKWASEWQKGVPDLILSFPNYGVHLCEVKHRPEFGVTEDLIPNPLDKAQRKILEEYAAAGAFVFAYVIGGGSTTAVGSTLYAFYPWEEHLDFLELPRVTYAQGHKYYVLPLIKVMHKGGPNG